ncbi:unnamed protein product, partial [Gulo gulo]
EGAPQRVAPWVSRRGPSRPGPSTPATPRGPATIPGPAVSFPDPRPRSPSGAYPSPEPRREGQLKAVRWACLPVDQSPASPADTHWAQVLPLESFLAVLFFLLSRFPAESPTLPL